ncbi:MAG: TonB-dependent receptor domain-containing protein [Terriglobales bacterium]
MKRVMTLCIVIFVTLAMVGSAAAQSAATAELHVTVKDPKGAVVKNATVTVRNEALGTERAVTQNTDGAYQFLSLPPGRYTINVKAPGFATLVARAVSITVGQTAEVPVNLQVASVESVVNVSTEPELIETQRTVSTTTIEQERIENLPINGRNYINFALTDSKLARDTAPSIGAAPTSGLNFGGQRARSNLVNVDGTDAVDNSTNGVRSTVSQEAVQEFQVMTNGYAAEYGRASGGVVNIITKSGTNDFHGSAYGYLRNRKIQAVNPFSNVPDPAYTRVQAGATMGGALKKDQTFYFFSFETTRRHETGFSTIGQDQYGLLGVPTPLGTLQLTPQQAAFLQSPTLVGYLTSPSALARATANTLVGKYLALAGGGAGIAINGALPLGVQLAGGFPVANMFPTSSVAVPAVLPASFMPLSGQTGNYPVFEGTTVYSLRLDHRLTANHQLMVRGNVSPSTANGIQVQGQNQNFGQNGYSRTATQQFRDFAITVQEAATIGTNKVNEFRFQGARRGLLFDFNEATPTGPDVAVNIQGFAFIGREPFSAIRRTEKRYQFTDNFSWSLGKHAIKFGGDLNRLPVNADFAVNFGGVYNFAGISAPSGLQNVLPGLVFPDLNAVQAYGIGVPQYFIQGVGNPHAQFANTPLGFFLQDSWRLKPNLTLNYGVRYDVEFLPSAPPLNAISTPAYAALGIANTIPTDKNNIAPRIGIAWDPWNDGKTVIRGSYGLFYDHPLLGIQFLAQATDAVGTPQILLGGASTCDSLPAPTSPVSTMANGLTATSAFQGTLKNCLGLGGFGLGGLSDAFGYISSQQRFNSALPNSLWINQNYLAPSIPVAPGVNLPTPLPALPFGFPVSADFQYAYSNQANLSIERDLGKGYALSVDYNFNGGRHLNRPINANTSHGDLLWQNYANSTIYSPLNPSNALQVQDCGLVGGKPVVPAALANFFRPSGMNPTLASWVSLTPAGAACVAFTKSFLAAHGLGVDANGQPLPVIPFSDMSAQRSNGSSVYHGLTMNLKKRFSTHYEFLASYTWSHAIDDSTDLESPLAPQDAYNLRAERSNSTFDQRHRFVFSGVYQTGKVAGEGFWSKFGSNWTFSPIIEAASGRPYTVFSATSTRNFQFAANSARPNIVALNAPVDSCGDPVVTSPFISGIAFQLPCPADGSFDGNSPRNHFTKPYTLFTDFRVARRINLTERVGLDAIMDVFNLINKFNVADVNPLYTEAGRPTAAFDPRQFQFALKLTW